MPNRPDCLSEETIVDFAFEPEARLMGTARKQAVRRHVAMCPECRGWVETVRAVLVAAPGSLDD